MDFHRSDNGFSNFKLMSGPYPPPGTGYPPGGFGPPGSVSPQTQQSPYSAPGPFPSNGAPFNGSGIYPYQPNMGSIGHPGPSSPLPYNPNSVYTPYNAPAGPALPPAAAPHPMVYSGISAQTPPPQQISNPIQNSQITQYHFPQPYPAAPASNINYGVPSSNQGSSYPTSLQYQSSPAPYPVQQQAPPPQQAPSENLAAAQQNLVQQQRQGVIKVDLKGFYWLVDPQSPSSAPVFISSDSLNTAADGDTAVAQLHQRTDGKLSGVIIKILSRAQPPPLASPPPAAAPSRRKSVENMPEFIEGVMSVDSKGRGIVTHVPTGEIVILLPASIQATGAKPGDSIRVQIQSNAGRTSDGYRLGYAIVATPKGISSPSPVPQRSPSQPHFALPSHPTSSSQAMTPSGVTPGAPQKPLPDLQRELNELTMQLGMHQFQVQMTQQRGGASQLELDALLAQQYHLTDLMQQKQAEIAVAMQQAPAASSQSPPPLVLPPGHVAVVPGQSPVAPPVSAGRKGPEFIWAPGMPNYMKLSESERTALKQQFQSMDKENRGYIGEKELRDSLGLVGFDEVLTKLFTRAFDLDNDKMISQDDFMNTMAVMLKGTAVEKLAVGYNMIDYNASGRITREDFFRIINSMYRVLTNMRIPVYESDIHSYVNDLWHRIDIDGTGVVSRDTFVAQALKNQSMIIGLGVVNIPPDPPKLPKRGVSVSFGHFYWSLALQMMVGMRLAIDQQRGREEKSIKAVDFTEVKQFEISSNDLTKKYVFTDYAPFVFKRLREMSGIDETNYMFSLGPEQLLGNMILGNLSSLSMSLSEGKSGSFFFTSHDGRFLVKTISSLEVACLKKMLPHYYQHMATNVNTMLVRIYGFHSINQQTFIVMGNVFSTHLSIDELYDLKGSTVGRTGGQSSVKKDLDFNRTIRFSQENRDLFLQQLQADANFLKQNNVIDYSLLVGIRKMRKEDWAEELKYPVLINGKVPFWAQVKGGMRGFNDYGQPGDEIFFVGVIDIFTEYGLIKQAENLFKSLVHGPDRISAIPADRYAERFLRYISSLVR